MILSLNSQESAALVLHMSIMRKSFRNLIKKQYKEHKTDYLASYDYVLEESKKALESTVEKEMDFYTSNLNIRDLEILSEFLRAYTNKIVAEDLEKHLSKEDREQLKVLSELWRKCNEMILESA